MIVLTLSMFHLVLTTSWPILNPFIPKPRSAGLCVQDSRSLLLAPLCQVSTSRCTKWPLADAPTIVCWVVFAPEALYLFYLSNSASVFNSSFFLSLLLLLSWLKILYQELDGGFLSLYSIFASNSTNQICPIVSLILAFTRSSYLYHLPHKRTIGLLLSLSLMYSSFFMQYLHTHTFSLSLSLWSTRCCQTQILYSSSPALAFGLLRQPNSLSIMWTQLNFLQYSFTISLPFLLSRFLLLLSLRRIFFS